MSLATQRLVEREDELDRAGAALDLIAAGEGRVISIEGPAGIGKSALLAGIRAQASDRGFRLFSARGGEMEIDFAFGVVRQLFEGAATGPGAGEAAFAGAAAPAEGVFAATAGHGEVTPSGAVSFSALHGLYWMALNLAGEEPALLVVDDLHWCDRPSLRFLAYLGHRLDGTKLGILSGLRTTEPGTDPALVADLIGDASAVGIRPGPLSVSALGAVVESRFGRPGDEPFLEACRRGTGGNPLLINQLVGELVAEGRAPTAASAEAIADVGPRVVSRSVLSRLRRLPPEATEVARAAAVLGEGTNVPAIAALIGRDQAAVAESSGALVRAEVLGPEAGLGFLHPLVREAVYEDIPIGERQLMHARAAKMMEEAGAPAERVAAQLLAAAPSGEPWAVERLTQAATQAIAGGAADSAVTYLTRVLEEPVDAGQRPVILMQLGMAEAGTGGADAVEHLQAAYETLEQPELRGVAAYALSRALIFVGESQRAAELAADARVRLAAGGHDDLARIVESVELISAYFGADVPGAEERFRAHRTLAPEAGGGESVLAAAASYDWIYRGGSARECADLASEAVERAAQMEFDTGLTWIVANVVLVAADRPEAMVMWDRALARAHRQGGMFGVMTVHLWRGFAQLRYGELAEAESSLRAGVEQIKLLRGATLDYAHGLLATALLEQGRVEEAERQLQQIDPPTGKGDGALLWRVAEIELMLANDRPAEALGAARLHAEACAWRTNPAFAPSRALEARALAALGRAEEAEEILRDDLELARRWGADGTVGRALRLLGEVRGAEGVGELESSIELLEGSPMKLDLAKALLALGTARRAAGQPDEAREPLRRAYELAELCGAEGLASAVRAELRTAGVRPRTSALKGAAALTASEGRVAEMAAEGLTNKEIAQTLFVTPKTIEVHLSNSYRKLEISSRRELPAALAA